MKLTYAIARALMPPAGKLDHIVWDEGFGGFGVRIRAGGKRIRRMWIYQYDFAGRTRRISLGNVEAISLQDARQTASELHAKIRLGHDPASEKAENRLRATVTFGAMVADYLPRARAKMRPRSYADVERHLLSYCKPLHGVPLEAIARRDVAHLFSTVTENHGKGAANNMLYALSAFFSWAINEGRAETNPASGANRHSIPSRDRVLSLPELVAVWHALDHYGAPTLNFKHIVRLLMLTGQRESEISNLIWREVADTALLLPATRTKNKRPHAVPLTAPALAILAEPRRGQGDDFIFRSYGKATAFASWGTSKRRLDEQLATDGFELAPWRIHDLRRSVATHMGELGVMPHVIEAVLNHISGSRKGVAGVYNRSTLEPQKRAALELWAEHLMAHVEGREHEVTGKVLPFRA